ncbi:MAG: tyrosine-type recombinase/integrase [Mariniphaga sp.]|nr:tyrosine-type recombinase/integrase [Mariniphaga sp.]
MANLKYYIDSAKKPNEKGCVPIRANVVIDGKNNWKNIGEVKPKYWNRKKQRVIEPRKEEKDNDFEKTNLFLDDYQYKAKEFFRKCLLQNIQVTSEIVQNFYIGQESILNPVKKEFWEAYEEFLKAGELERAANTIRNRKTIKNYLKKFETTTRYKMTFESINLVFFDRLKENVLITNARRYNYLSSINDKFKAFMTWSHERDYHTNTIYKRFSAPEKEGSIIHLTFPELQQLINFKFENLKLRNARDFFCFGCLTGLRYCDLQRLTKGNVSDGLIKITTQKTNKEVIIPLFQGVTTIIERYPEQYKLLPKFSNQRLNDYIKECCKLALINTPTEYKTFEKNITITEHKPKFELIGTHTARKTFICLAYDRGMDIEMIKSITGITREKTLRRYLQVSRDLKIEKLTAAFGDL